MDEPEIIGRADTLATCAALIQQALTGSGQVAIVYGEQGIGKTTLMRHIVATACRSGMRTLTSRGDRVSQSAPYAQWVTVLESAEQTDLVAATVGQLRSRHADTHDGWSARELVAGVVGALIELVRRQPLCIALDDLHLFDPASLDVLVALAGQTEDVPLLLVVGYRDDLGRGSDQLSFHIPALMSLRNATRMHLRRLTNADIKHLIHSRYTLSARDESRLEHYLQLISNGNPLVATELLHALESSGALEPDDQATGSWRLGTLPRHMALPVLRDLVAQRLRQLTENDLLALQIAAVIGHQFDLDIWQQVCGLSVADLEVILERTTSASILRESDDGEGYTFSHPVNQEVVYHDMVLPRRRRIHRNVGERLASRRNPDVFSVAHHFSAARDQRAVDWLLRAGRQAEQTYALVTAAMLYEDALGLLNTIGDQDTRVVELLFRMALVQRYADPFRSRSYLDEALDLAAAVDAPGVTAGIRHYRALMRCWTGDIAGGLDELQSAVADIAALPGDEYDNLNQLVWFGDRDRDEHRGTLVDWYCEVGRFTDALHGYDDAAAAPSLPPPGGGQIRISPPGDRLSGIATSLAQVGRPHHARTVYQTVRRTFESIHHHHSLGWMYLNELQYLAIPFDSENRDRLQWLADRAMEAWERSSSVLDAALPRRAQLPLLYLRGAWQEVREKGELSRSAPPGAPGYLDPLPFLAAVAYHTGDRATLRSLISDVLPHGPGARRGSHLFNDAVEIQILAARAALDDGDTEYAEKWIDAHEHWIEWSGARRYVPGLSLLRAMLARQRDDLQAATVHALSSVETASDPRQPLALVAAWRLLGELRAEQGELTEAESLLIDAVTLARRVGSPLETMLCLISQAEILAQVHRGPEALSAGDSAREIALGLGAVPALQRIERLRTSLRLDSADDVLALLTPREFDVLQRLAQGLTTREIALTLDMSVRTSERHIANIYAKLGVNQRAEAIAYAISRGIA